MKQKLGVKFYVHYNDDFFIVADDRNALCEIAPAIQSFLSGELKLNLPPENIKIQSIKSGVDVLGTVVFDWGAVPRARIRKAAEKTSLNSLRSGYTSNGWRSAVSYLGLLGHTKSFFLREKLRLAYLL